MKTDITSNAAEIAAKLQGFPPVMGAAVARAMDAENLITVGHIVKTKLTNAGPKYLNRRTGRLGGSMRASAAVVKPNQVRSAIGTNVRYAGVHEFGFDGTQQVRAHTRRAPQGDRFTIGGRIVARATAAALGALDASGRLRRRKGNAQVASGTSRVRAHTRKVHFRARHMIEDGIRERLPEYRLAISQAIVTSWEGGQP